MIRDWIRRRFARPIGVVVEPVEQRPGFWPEWGVMTEDGFRPADPPVGSVAYLAGWCDRNAGAIRGLLEHLDELAMDQVPAAVEVAERIRREKSAAWDEAVEQISDWTWNNRSPGDADPPTNPYEADQ